MHPDDPSKLIRDTSIEKWEIDTIGENYLKIQVNFTSVLNISIGGIEYQDGL